MGNEGRIQFTLSMGDADLVLDALVLATEDVQDDETGDRLEALSFRLRQLMRRASRRQ